MVKYILFLFTILLPVTTFSQTIANPYTSTEEKFKSPQVHLLKQFVDHPVDLSRGLVDITIPIYDIKFANQTIPIKLMFHPSGLKANAAENGILGLKWALDASGFISREVKGIPDEQRPHKQGITTWYTPDWMTLYGGGADRGYTNNNVVFRDNLGYLDGYPWNSQGKYEDTEYDIFTFSLPNGQSGKFILKDNNGEKSASFMPYKPYKLNNPEVGFAYSNNQFYKFDITDDQGYVYSFGKRDSYTYCEFDIENKYTNSWMLTSITSPNKKDVITFDYILTTTDGNSPLTPLTINDDLDDPNGNYYFEGQCNVSADGALMVALKDILWERSGYLNKNYNPVPYHNNSFYQLTKITYNKLVINFIYPGNGKLNKIEILNDNKILQKAEFNIVNNEQSYLNSVIIKDPTDNIVEKYSFDYYHLDKLPSVQNLANKADYWGYYQSEVENVILKDTVNILFNQPGCAENQVIFREEIGSGNNRYSNAEDMKVGMIKSITYPTGGTTTFDYESNQYKDNSNTIRQCGGLRIKSIINEGKYGSKATKREFTYGENEDGIGRIPSYLTPDVAIRNSFEETRTMYLIDDDTDPNIGYSKGTYRSRYMSGFFPGSYYAFLYNIVAYDKVTEYSGEIDNNIGKIENYYSINIPLNSDYEFDYNSSSHQRYIIDPSSFWRGNHLSKKIEYKKDNQIYSKVKETEYLYEENTIDEIYDLSILKFKNVVGYKTSGDTPHWSAITELQLIKDHPTEFFGYKTQKYTIGAENLSSTREEVFFNNGKSIVQTTTNKYDNNKPTFLKESITTTSKGDNLTQKFLYPFNINAGVYSQMTQANVISPLIEKVALKGDKVIGSSLLTYKKSDDNFVPDQNHVTELSIPVPYSGFTNFNGSGKDLHYNANPEITYDLYDDYGNPKQITSKGKITTCYVWGYDKQYPIAKIENAAYTTGLPNSITTVQQTLIDNAILASVGETTLLTEANLITKLQLLREGFPDAIVTTYTYDPLIGITSITDPRGYTTYYEYDTFGRLKQVKDKDSKILSSNNYHYKEQ
ncbi:RHS repeat domain-containing protein [Flavobacterium sp. N1736]|uniref:RHS repeat domain-containing protein n=1 Tax=Flavobacterium sp. N1736 TaxID=2986823 RepID=UPI00222482C1|nr:RHS repeat domain-containing protein [Flavobacterium sp. N1736]